MAVETPPQPGQLPSTPVVGNGARQTNHHTARLIAIIAGLLGAALAIATPFLPVKQTTAQLNWPQNDVLGSVNAPLIGYVATDLDINIPCSAAAILAGPQNAGRTVLLSTVPKQPPKAIDRGLLIERVNNDLLVIVRNTPVVTAPLSQVLSPACEKLTFTAHADKVTGEFVGLTKGPDTDDPGAPLRGERSGYDFRPQIVGVFTDLAGPAPPGLHFSATVDSRYSTSPTLLKLVVMIVGVAMTIIALGALHVLDAADGMRHKRFLPPRWWSIRPLDAIVIAVLAWWHFVGANTSDDGYILTMARVSEHAGYMANYYRWFGTPEAPFGWYYDLLALWAHVSTNSVWVRLPTLLMALTCWWVISREVIPRLGHAVKTSRAAAWTAAGMFLAFWLPLNNGLRPEPIIALGILLTWCSVERGVATSRLLRVAIALIIGALTLFSGPTGIAAVGALLVAIGPLKTIVAAHVSRFGYLALLAPILAAGTVTIILIFRDQTLASEIQASTFKATVGPSLAWFDEHIRYERLFMASPDGSIARRFAVLTLLLALAVSVAMTLRKGRIPGTAAGPSRRIVGITIISFLAMMFTPTKWTHHFGVFAGLAGSLGALAADPVMEPQGTGNFADTDGSVVTGSEPGTEGGTTAAAGVNGSRARLPYGLDPRRVPVMGSWRAGAQQPAVLRSTWYRLPERSEAGPLLVVAAAGRFDPGEVVVQWATDAQAAKGQPGGGLGFADVGAAPAWRNLRAPLAAIPSEATVVRIVASDDDLSPQHWIAGTPPRIPVLRTLQEVVGSTDPVLLDWLVGLAFPCQRPFGHQNGVTEVPKWRILPDRFGAEANSPVMDYLGGGPLGITELLMRASPVPTYLKDDWFRDWGALQRLTRWYPNAQPARLDLGTATRSGLWSPAPLRPS